MGVSAPPRKYVMTRLRHGDYLLPSNDARTLWRIYTYVEDGSLADGDREVRGTFWACARRSMPDNEASMGDLGLDDWDGWEFWAGPLRTRREAIDEALRWH